MAGCTDINDKNKKKVFLEVNYIGADGDPFKGQIQIFTYCIINPVKSTVSSHDYHVLDATNVPCHIICYYDNMRNKSLEYVVKIK